MALKKIIYFTATALMTGPEAAAIASLADFRDRGYVVVVRNADIPNIYGAGIEAADYVMGTIPTAYNNAGTYPIFVPATPPAPTVGATQKVVTSGVAVTGVTMTGTAGAGKSFTPTVAAGVLTTAAFA